MEKSDSVLSKLARQPLIVRVLILVGLLLVCGFAYWNFSYSPTIDKIKKAEKKQKERTKEKQNLNADIKDYESIKPLGKELGERIERNNQRLPSESSPLTFINYIEKKATETLMSGFRYKSGASVTIEDYVKTPIDVEVQGTYYQLLKLFYEISPYGTKVAYVDSAEEAPLVTVENLRLTKPTYRGIQVVLSASFTVSTFHMKEGASILKNVPQQKRPTLQKDTQRPQKRRRRPGFLGQAESDLETTNKNRAAELEAATGVKTELEKRAPAGGRSGDKGLNRLRGGGLP